MADDFIRVKLFGEANLTGYKLKADLVTDFDFDKGFDTTDLSLPTSTKRVLLPTSGLKTDLVFAIELGDDGTNKAFSIDNIGNETEISNTTTTSEQLNFLLDTFMSANLSAFYEVYIDWNGKTYTGILRVRGRVSGEQFFNRILVNATLKSGTNVLGL